MTKLWRIHAHDSARIETLARAAGVPGVVAQLLICRGIHDPHAARDFLDPKLSALRDPEELPGAVAAAERITLAIAQKERIIVYGDYDVDGIAGTALLWRCLRLLGADAGYYVPHRMDEGYGLNDAALNKLAGEGAKLVVTVDCGIGSLKESETARGLGLELIITDHHEPGASLPYAAAIAHPRLPDSSYPFGGLCGAGVAFKLAWLLCRRASGSKKVGERMRNYLLEATGLAALATVADVVPLVDENRVLVCHGLASLRERAGPGMAALLKVTGLAGKQRFDGDDVGFTLGPRLNAAGRLGQARLGVELLTTENPARAMELAQYIDQLNGSRQSLERSVYLAANKQAQEQFDPAREAALVLADRGWHPGVIGIVAGRLAEKYHRPVVLLSLDELGVKPAAGSARSVPGFKLHEALAACGRHLTSHGGHAAAAGLKIDEANIDRFREDFCEYASAEINEADRTAELWIDAESPLAALSLKTVGQIERLAPFGAGNPRPVLCASGVKIADPPKRIGGGGRHLSLRLSQHDVSMRAVAFGGGDWADELAAAEGPLSIAFRPTVNEFRGRRTVELHLTDWQAAQPVEVKPVEVTG